ncbi:MAG: class II glutamine amidotransferase [Methanobacteriota archaeon]
MCRVIAYVGPPRDLSPYLLEGPRSLRALACKHGDGWGRAVWADGVAHVVKSVANAEADKKFEETALVTRASPQLWHIRNASDGTEKREVDNHPFADGRFAFAHNGTVRALLPPHREAIMPRTYRLTSSTDSEAAFRLFLDRVGGRPRNLEQAAGVLKALSHELVARSPEGRARNQANFFFGDGEGFAVTRLGKELSYLVTDDAAFVASEPLGPEAAWTEVPEGAALVARPGHVVLL